jgi:F420-dependent oxidoreductase-like protein
MWRIPRVRIALMIEGQEGVSWPQWVALAEACEEHGIETLFRSDHYLSGIAPAERESLDAWTTLAGLAARTSRLRLGTLVSPVTFRHPSLLAKAVVTVDHISGGRVELGMGAGWMEEEHRAYGFDFPPARERAARLAEQVEIVHRQWTEERARFEGSHYRIDGAPGLPKPVQRPRPPLIVGGQGGPGTVRPAVRFADEYNTYLADQETCRLRRATLDDECERQGRDPTSLSFSLMTGFLLGRDEEGLRERARRIMAFSKREGDPAEVIERYRARGVAGSPADIAEGLRSLQDARVDRVMLQHLLHDDLETVAVIGEEVAPLLA